MSKRLLSVRGGDPLLFRDGRPFADEVGALTAQSLPLPLPGTLAGLLRSCLGSVVPWNWKTDGPERARATAVAGPLLCLNGNPVYPTPADALHVGNESNPQVMMLRPAAPKANAGCDLPTGLLPMEITAEDKPLPGFRFWSQAVMTDWLAGKSVTPDQIGGLPTEERTHAAMCYATGAGEPGKLFRTDLVAFEAHGWKNLQKTTDEQWSLLARLTTSETVSLPTASPFGGERRLAQIEEVTQTLQWPTCPAAVMTALAGKKTVRLVLATPALFQNGWKPGWLGAGLTGRFAGVTLTLKAAVLPRREPVSGWDFERAGPKPVRWMVPAGTVYFFEVEGDAMALAEANWLEPVSDDPQDQRDGYGLALWGCWNE